LIVIILAYVLHFASPGFSHFFSEIVWKEHPRNDWFCVKRDDKHLLNQSVSQSVSQSINQAINQSIHMEKHLV